MPAPTSTPPTAPASTTSLRSPHDPATAAAWAALDDHHRRLGGTTLRELFAGDPRRFDTLSARHGDLLLDASKCRLTPETIGLLKQLAQATGVEARRDRMFAGETINATEGRAVLHVALRAAPGDACGARAGGGIPAQVAQVADVLARLADYAAGVRSGTIKGATGQPFTDVVNIGIGGSDLGPAMATAALRPFADGPRVHFVSNVDGAHISDTISGLDPARTLVLVASKTFTTIETMTNARTARAWIAGALGEAAVGHHFVALSAAVDKAAAFGIPAERVFGFWDWVGGRYSVWSAIGLPLMIAIGPDNFARFLAGARDMDGHFRAAPIEANLPMLLGLVGVWQRAVCGHATRAVIPYEQRLARLPAYLQQLEMESNGKRVGLDGAPATRPTAPVVWGAAGTDAQHSFFQMLHQGTDIVPVEFLIGGQGFEPDLAHQHALLIANCLAQSEALALGRTEAEAEAAMLKAGVAASEARRLAPHKTFPGNRPSITLCYRRLDPATLGRLIALYEHRVFVEAAVHGINAFDQWGVELGKELALELEPLVTGKADAAGRNGSTVGLVAWLRG